LAGALLVGVSYAKALAFALDKPLIAVNHIEGHIHAVLLEQRQAGSGAVEFPVLSLVVSGGHTHLYLATQAGSGWRYENIGHTRDDAAGEAFDKVAKLLGLGYPGGPIIDKVAKYGDPAAVKFGLVQMKHRDRNDRGKAVSERPKFDFSYSGIKTAVLRYVETHGMADAIEVRRRQLGQSPTTDDYLRLCDKTALDLVASFQRAMVADLVAKTMAAAREFEVGTLLVTGGVAANSELRIAFGSAATEEGIRVFFPSRPLSTDNAAMIAAAAYSKWLSKDFAGISLTAEANLPLR
jgi:N6-L-threonylcarbamoyladenine synthase